MVILEVAALGTSYRDNPSWHFSQCDVMCTLYVSAGMLQSTIISFVDRPCQPVTMTAFFGSSACA